MNMCKFLVVKNDRFLVPCGGTPSMAKILKFHVKNCDKGTVILGIQSRHLSSFSRTCAALTVLCAAFVAPVALFPFTKQ